MKRYRDRRDAGKTLAQHLLSKEDLDIVVLGIPRGGVPVAFEVAKALQAPLDVFIVRKLGLPGYEELAMGAVASGNVRVLNSKVIEKARVSEQVIEQVAQEEWEELKRREQVYREGKPLREVKDKITILVDDGLATGSTMRAAVSALKKLKPSEIIVAVPVAAEDAYEDFSRLADEIVCPLIPSSFDSVGRWYEEFEQTTDEEVKFCLREAKHFKRKQKASDLQLVTE